MAAIVYGSTGLLRGITTLTTPFDIKDVLALAVDLKASFLQRLRGAQVIYAGQLRHQLRGDNFHLSNLTARLGFAVNFQIFPDRVFDVFQRLLDVRSL